MQSFYGKLGVIGAGKMGEAIIRGLLAAGMKPDLLLACDKDHGRQVFLRDEYRVRAVADSGQLAREVDIIILAVKPQVMESVLTEIAPMVKKNRPLVISVGPESG